MSKSEFGKGLAYNLVLFASHFENHMVSKIGRISFVLRKSREERAKILCDVPDSSHNYGWNSEIKWWFDKIVPHWKTPEKALSHEVTLWANGASDHLYEIQIPEAWRRKSIGKKIAQLKELGLEMGHGLASLQNHNTYTADHVTELMTLTKDIAFLIDKELGANPIKAEYE